MRCQIVTGDMRDVLASFDAESVDAVVTDPPYNLTNRTPDVMRCADAACGRVTPLAAKAGDPCPRCGGPMERQRSKQGRGFMGKEWDGTGIAFDPETWQQVKRVMKPGAYLAAFGGARTFHRQAVAIEDARFVLQDTLMWMHGQGWPKGKSALKPAWEPVTLARNPGRGVLNVDACRVQGVMDGTWGARQLSSIGYGGTEPTAYQTTKHEAGRWPPNVLLSHSPACVRVGEKRVKGSPKSYVRSTDSRNQNAYGKGVGELAGTLSLNYADADGRETVEAWECVDGCPVAELDRQSGERRARKREAIRGRRPGGFGNVGADKGDRLPNGPQYGDTGGASRFFPQLPVDGAYTPFLYTAKASTKERGEGNDHPTVKPLAVMRWLVRLIAPPGGLVIDPFAGSGTTGLACLLEGRDFLGIEQDPHNAEIARRRIADALGPLFAADASS